MHRAWASREFIAALVGLVLGIGQAGAQQMRDVTYIVVNNLFSTPAYVAAENGYWAKQGLNVSVKLTSSGRAVVQAVQAGEGPVGHPARSPPTPSARPSGQMPQGGIA